MSRWLYWMGGEQALELGFAGSELCSLSRAATPAHDELTELDRQHPVAQALGAYFSGDFSRYTALLPRLQMQLRGTPHQLRVWRALQEIPLGSVRSYGDLAQCLGSAPQAIGQACRHNPIAILIPCHRVLARQGWGGYAGQRQGPELEWKKHLLRHEGFCHAAD